MLALRVLGPVAVSRDGVTLPITIRKTAALLVLLSSGSAVGRGRVVGLLWPQLDESVGRRNLRRELARLREIGAGDLVSSDGDALRLSESVDCDLRQFEADLSRGHPDQALSVWRGPLADGLDLDDAAPFHDWLATERSRLSACRHRALAGSAAVHESRGALEPALDRVQALLDDDPLQEQHQRDAMRLLAGLGRREAALAQYERCRALLAEELGLAPMAETVELLQALRSGSSRPPARGGGAERPTAAPTIDSALNVAAASAMPASWPAAATAGEPGSSPAGRSDTPPVQPEGVQPVRAPIPLQLPFVGREPMWEALAQAWERSAPVLIVGEGGVGKTRLALDFAAARGAVAHVACRPGDIERPYAAIARALRLLAVPDPQGAQLPDWVRREVSRLLPALGPPPPPLQSDEDRARFFEAVASAWLAWADGDFDAVILDDAHLADATSLAVMGHIAQRRREQGGSLREWLLVRTEIGADSLQRLTEDLQATVVTLQPWTEDEVLDLVRRLSGAQAPLRFAQRLSRATGGNPFFVAETLRHLSDQSWLQVGPEGRWQTPVDEATLDYGELPLPASVREAVLARVRRLGAASGRVLEAAALASEPFSPALLAPACALSELHTVLAIEQAVQAHLLREHAGGYAFAHDLVQQALDADLSPERRRLVHRRLALGAEAAAAPPAVIAGHHEASGDARRAIPHRLAAGDAAARLHAVTEAAAQWRMALEAGPEPAIAVQLHMRLARARRWLNDPDGAVAEVQALVDNVHLVTPDVAHDALIEAASTLIQVHRAYEVPPLLDRLPPAPDAQRAARADLRRLEALRDTGRFAEARALGRVLRAAGALQGLERAELIDAMALNEWHDEQIDAGLALLEEAVELSRQIGDEAGLVRSLYRRGQLLRERGDLAAAEESHRSGLQASRRLGRHGNTLAFMHALCEVLRRRQQWRALADLVTEARQPPVGPPRGLLAYAFRVLAITAWHALGDVAAAHAEAKQALEDLPQLPAGIRVGAAQMLPLAPCVEVLGPDALAGLEADLRPLCEAAGPDGADLLARIRQARGGAGVAAAGADSAA